ncbi:hypothetical protein ZIOFF_063039 [Zingiber officinale]|uniref:Serine aminopeptidase S33 domain-containing protein n=1 Tax=Zingiber officinale TaxID=94328 RepID=A0A8J5F162_ZINOF|nr:hypothetical protein ZIOFF_063039 [Zingiber officinale]
MAQPGMLTSGASGRIAALLSLRVLGGLLILLRAAALLLLLPFRWRSVPASEVDGRPEASKKGGRGGVVVRVPAAMLPRRQREQEAAWRRALAIRRVMEARQEGRLERDFALLTTARDDTLFTQSWSPLNRETRGLVVLLHGLNEHRYDHFAKKLNDNGFKVYAMDWIGHGGSDGLHGYVPSLDYAVADLLLAPLFCLLAPKYQFSNANNSASPVSRDAEAVESKYTDPLVFTGSIRVKTGYEVLRLSAYLMQNLYRVNVPFLVLHGTSDDLTDPEGSRRLFDEASSTDKSIKLYPGLLHDLLIEPECDKIMTDIIDWFSCRVC